MFKDLLKRADYASVVAFIMDGGELTELPDEQTIEERLNQASAEIHNFIMSNFDNKNVNEREKANSLTLALGELEASYFELGLLSGIKFGTQLQKKLMEIK